MLDPRLGLVGIVGGLLLLFPVFNTLNSETVDLDQEPPKITPPDNFQPPPFTPPPSETPPPCFPTNVPVGGGDWEPEGDRLPFFPGTPDRNSVSESVPPEMTAATIYLNYTSFRGSISITLTSPDGTEPFEERRTVESPTPPLGTGGDPPFTHEFVTAVALTPGTWTLAWDNQVDEGRVVLEVIGHIRCDESQPPPEDEGAGQ